MEIHLVSTAHGLIELESEDFILGILKSSLLISLYLSVNRILLKFVIISVTVVWSSGVSFRDYSMESAHKHFYSQVVMHQFHTY